MAAGPTDPGGAPTGLGGARWPELVAHRTLLLVPVGSTEQHGPHLPLATDAVVATAVARAAALRCLDLGVRVAPTLAYGASGEHQDFPGTLSIGHRALELLLVELTRSASSWTEGVVFVNGHGGNVPTLSRAVDRMRAEGHAVGWTSCAVRGADAHAGRTETSLLLHLAPGTVHLEDAVAGPTTPVAGLLPRLRADGVRAVSASGVLGDPVGASAAEGAEIFAGLVARLVAELQSLEVDENGRLRPAAVAAP